MALLWGLISSKIRPKITRSENVSSGAALDGAPGKTTVGDKDIEARTVSSGASLDASPRKIRTEDQSSAGFSASAGAALDALLAKIPTKKAYSLAVSTGAAADPHLYTVGVETDGQMRSEMLSTGASASGGLRKLPPVRSYVAMVTAGAALDGAIRKLLVKGGLGSNVRRECHIAGFRDAQHPGSQADWLRNGRQRRRHITIDSI